MNTLLIVLVIIEAIALIVLAFFLTKSSLAYRKIMKKAELIVQGKLDVEDMLVEGSKNSAAVMASAFDSIKNNLLTFIEATKVNVITLSDAIEVLSSSVDANLAGNEQIAEGVTAVAQKSSDQLEMVEKNMELIESSNIQVQEIEKAMLQIKEKLDETVQTSKKGMSEVNEYSADINVISEDLARINQIMEQLNAEIKQIEEVGDFIIGINNKLMLLAFNASIEAARAGQAGRGFVVVADEMNKMSIDTKEGMEKITRIVGEIIGSSNEVNNSIKNCENAFNQSKSTFESVDASFKSINQQAFDIHDSVQAISGKTGMIAENSNELKHQADGLYEASHQISERTLEVAAASEETAAESSQISVNVGELSGMLSGIQTLLKQFNTAVVPAQKDSSKKIKIAFFTMLDNEFWYGVRRGVFYAMKELADKNIFIDYIPLGLDPNKPQEDQMNEKLQECINESYDGIIFPGFVTYADRALNDAIARGIKVLAFNCECSPAVKRLAVFSPNGYEAGGIAAKHMEKALNKKGNIAIISGDITIQVNKDRKEGFLNKLASYKGIHIISDDVVADTAEATFQKTVERLKRFPDIDAFYVTTGFQTAIAKAIEDLGMKGKVVTVGFDDNQEIFEYIKKGIIYATITQDPFGQGHDPIVWMYNHVVAGEQFPKEQMGCRLSVITNENVGNLISA